jgi:hypothetical protein
MMVRIFRPAKTAMQSGRAKTGRWVMEYELQTARKPEPLMGWVSAGDTKGQVRLEFETKDDAIAYAKKHNLMYQVVEPKERRIKPKAYSDNFAFDRGSNWTH